MLDDESDEVLWLEKLLGVDEVPRLDVDELDALLTLLTELDDDESELVLDDDWLDSSATDWLLALDRVLVELDEMVLVELLDCDESVLVDDDERLD